MREKGVPEKYVKIIQDMCNRVQTHVQCSVGEMEKFPVKVGLHQGSALSPYLFNLIMDVISAEVRDKAPLSMLFADDIILSSSQHENVEKKLEEWRKVMEDRGLKISRRKTEHLQYNKEGDGCIKLHDQELNRVKKFRYLGLTLAEDGELDAEVDLRIQASWKNWRKLSGVLCNRRLSSRLKGMIFKTVVRPTMTYGTETWIIKKSHKRRMDVAEMKMLRWVQGVTRWDKIKNEDI